MPAVVCALFELQRQQNTLYERQMAVEGSMYAPFLPSDIGYGVMPAAIAGIAQRPPESKLKFDID